MVKKKDDIKEDDEDVEEELEEDKLSEKPQDEEIEIDEDALEELVLNDDDGSFERRRIITHILSNPEKEVSLESRWETPVRNLEEDLPEQNNTSHDDDDKKIEYEIFKLGDENKYDFNLDITNVRRDFDDTKDTIEEQKRLYTPIKKLTEQEHPIKYVKPESFDKHYLSKRKFGEEQ